MDITLFFIKSQSYDIRLYLDTRTYTLYLPIRTTVWQSPVSIYRNKYLVLKINLTCTYNKRTKRFILMFAFRLTNRRLKSLNFRPLNFQFRRLIFFFYIILFLANVVCKWIFGSTSDHSRSSNRTNKNNTRTCLIFLSLANYTHPFDAEKWRSKRKIRLDANVYRVAVKNTPQDANKYRSIYFLLFFFTV